jgi:hypothetical protein
MYCLLIKARTLRNLTPCLGVPGLAAFCSEVVWAPKIFPLGPQNRRPVRSSRHVLIERKAKSNAGGLVVLLIDQGAKGCYSRLRRGR